MPKPIVRPTFDDLKHFWAMVYSRSALLESDGWLSKMDSVSDEEIMSALVCAVIAAYGRPFTQSQVAARGFRANSDTRTA